ncbi:MAG TPA: serine/threonine-protein kinase [Kofleriaceae bacterium]|jgi:serine/threonine protein kinase|nr:serine/threonine-protein kinase [Kofleriaceae bacterium]
MEAGSRTETAWTAKYELLCPLAAGGMAELHLVRAQDPERGERLVVIKRLRRELAADPLFVRMFLDEARLASTLRHSNVVEVFEVGQDGEQCYIAMEHLHGHDLRDIMARVTGRGQRLRFEQALAIARSVATGLHYTHERSGADGQPLNIVHRDVSPHNVFLTYGGDVKIVDFGVAKASTQLARTRTGVLKGKVAYMSPEQASGQPLDRRSDVFCIGILLWEMTTGQWLYRKGSELDMLNAVAGERPPRPSRLVSGYPRDLEKIVMKTLARSRNERWATAGELAGAIDELARRRQWSLGPDLAGELVAREFSEEVAAWRAAQSSGTSLGDHLVAQRECAVVPASDDEVESELATAIGTPRLRERAGLRRPWFGKRTALRRQPRARTVLRRWLWPVLGVAALAGIAAAWTVTAERHATAPVVAPGSAGSSAADPVVPPLPPSPIARSPSPAPPTTEAPAPASAPVPATSPAAPTIPATPPPRPPRRGTAAITRSRSTAPSSATGSGSSSAAPQPPPAEPPPTRPRHKPTLDELDQLP